jgi:hypothetical protein
VDVLVDGAGIEPGDQLKKITKLFFQLKLKLRQPACLPRGLSVSLSDLILLRLFERKNFDRVVT